MSTVVNISVLRPHQINFIDDVFSAEKNGASKQFFSFFSKFFFDFPKKWGERTKKQQFKKKKKIPRKNGASREFFLAKKET